MWNNNFKIKKNNRPFEYFIIDNVLDDKFFKELSIVCVPNFFNLSSFNTNPATIFSVVFIIIT